MLIDELFEVYSLKAIQESVTLLDLLERDDVPFSDLKARLDEHKNNIHTRIVNSRGYAVSNKSIKEQIAEAKEEDEVERLKPMKPGSLEKMQGVVCAKCNHEIFITAVCCTNKLRKQGFRRKGICENCGNEFGIR